MLVSSTIGRRTGFMPRWFIVLGIAGALVMLFSVGFFEPLALIFPAWVAVVSILHPAGPPGRGRDRPRPRGHGQAGGRRLVGRSAAGRDRRRAAGRPGP